ncbi:MAG: ABC transporter ATP-binding protein/permease [Spirochaetes bacterium]|nr:ABC transporter ATP-binding protein/permease [Spirochaetota bacterium]
MGMLLRFLTPYWVPALGAVFLMTGEVVADVYQPLLMAKIIDIGIRNGDLSFIFSTGLRMILISLLGLIGGVGCTILSSFTSQSVGADLRERLFTHVLNLSVRSLDTMSPSTLVTRVINDVSQVQTFVLMMLRMMVRASLLLGGGTFMIILLNPTLTPLLLFFYAALFVGMGFLIRHGLPMFNLVQKKLDGVNRVLRENLAGIRLIKAFVRQEYEILRFEGVNRELKMSTVRVSRLMSGTLPLLFLSMNLCMVAILWFGAHQIQMGNLYVGRLIAIITYLTQILHSMMMVAFLIVTLARVKASISRIDEVLTLETEQEGNTQIREVWKGSATRLPEKSWSLEFQDVQFRYRRGEGNPILKNLSFRVEGGKTLGILGSTGAGKSTILALILRFYEPETGIIRFNGIPITEIPLSELRSRIAWVTQHPFLFTGTIRENILWGVEEAREEDLLWASRIAQVEEFVQKLPDGYDTRIGQRGVTLSGGQKQRISLARALLKKPSLLLLDDATSAVDLATEASIQEGLRTLKGTTAIVVTQRISSVIFADSILVLEQGNVAGWGTHRELIRSNPIYQDMFRSQMEEG